MKVVLPSGNPLCHNPRVVKEAEALASAGHEVEVLGSGTIRGTESGMPNWREEKSVNSFALS